MTITIMIILLVISSAICLFIGFILGGKRVLAYWNLTKKLEKERQDEIDNMFTKSKKPVPFKVVLCINCRREYLTMHDWGIAHKDGCPEDG
jgi:hypothetical protein